MPREVGWWWKVTGRWLRPKSAREVMSMLGAIGVYSSGQSFAWRGMSSADYTLQSSLHRKLGFFATEERVRKEEVETIRRARAWGLGSGAAGHVDDLQVLADLQHYGIPTRLIDFSSNPMTALWFACQTPSNPDVAKSGLLLALNTTGWPRYSTMIEPGANSYATFTDPLSSRLSGALEIGAPFVVESANPNDRLRAQEGFFVTGAVPHRFTERAEADQKPHFFVVDPFHSIQLSWSPGDPEVLSASLGVERAPGRPAALPFVAVIIEARIKTKLLAYLENTYNRSARVLFPDYAGFLDFGLGRK